jgi:hypothetical protein
MSKLLHEQSFLLLEKICHIFGSVMLVMSAIILNRKLLLFSPFMANLHDSEPMARLVTAK